MKQLQALVVFNTFLLCILLFLVIDLRKIVFGEYQSALNIFGRTDGSMTQMSSDIEKKFQAVGQALQSADNPPQQFQQVTGVISADPLPVPTQVEPNQPVPPSSDVTGLEITNETEQNGALRLTGIARDNQTIANYMQRLAKLGQYRDVNLLETRVTADGRRQFILEARKK